MMKSSFKIWINRTITYWRIKINWMTCKRTDNPAWKIFSKMSNILIEMINRINRTIIFFWFNNHNVMIISCFMTMFLTASYPTIHPLSWEWVIFKNFHKRDSPNLSSKRKALEKSILVFRNMHMSNQVLDRAWTWFRRMSPEDLNKTFI